MSWPAKKDRTRGWRELILAFIVGAGAMAVEMIASRLMAPYFGASLFVWTSLILTILVALAVGYWLGGLAAERTVSDAFVGLLLCAVGGLLFIGLLVSGGFSASLMGTLAAWPDASIALFLGSLGAAIAIFALPVLGLGMIGPILLKRLAAAGDVGRASGRYLVASTLGSAVGTLLPALVLVPNIGSRISLGLIAAVFLLTGAALLPRRAPVLLLVLAALSAVAAACLRPDQAAAGALLAKESPYQYIRVVAGDRGRRFLIFNEGSGIQSVWSPTAAPTGMYYDQFAAVPFLRPVKSGGQKVAVLGLAGGSAIRSYLSLLPPGSRVDVTGVELDGAVVEAARRFFGLDGLPVRVVEQDARNFLRLTADKFDTIIIDAYGTQLYIPPHLVTREFFDLVRSRLKPGGIAAMNVNVIGLDSPLFRSLAAALAGSFSEVWAVPVANSYNVILIASDRPLDPGRAASVLPPELGDVQAAWNSASRVTPAAGDRAFTDDWAPVEFMTDSMIVSEAFKQRQGLKE